MPMPRVISWVVDRPRMMPRRESRENFTGTSSPDRLVVSLLMIASLLPRPGTRTVIGITAIAWRGRGRSRRRVRCRSRWWRRLGGAVTVGGVLVRAVGGSLGLPADLSPGRGAGGCGFLDDLWTDDGGGCSGCR